jgi:hypothetical protein
MPRCRTFGVGASNGLRSELNGLQLFVRFFHEGRRFGFNTEFSNGLEDAEAVVRMPLSGGVVLAQLFLNEATALELLGAGETGPGDEKSLAADGTAHIAAVV